jgi:HPt (histidine-containing phosphotransfer) domain-containing protein
MDDTTLVDTARLLDSLGGREALAKTIAASFVRDLEDQVALLVKAYGDEDRERVGLLAHRFKGNLSILRAERARSVAEELEGAAQDTGADGLGRKVERLAVELRHVAVALTAWMAARQRGIERKTEERGGGGAEDAKGPGCDA